MRMQGGANRPPPMCEYVDTTHMEINNDSEYKDESMIETLNRHYQKICACKSSEFWTNYSDTVNYIKKVTVDLNKTITEQDILFDDSFLHSSLKMLDEIDLSPAIPGVLLDLENTLDNFIFQSLVRIVSDRIPFKSDNENGFDNV